MSNDSRRGDMVGDRKLMHQSDEGFHLRLRDCMIGEIPHQADTDAMGIHSTGIAMSASLLAFPAVADLNLPVFAA